MNNASVGWSCIRGVKPSYDTLPNQDDFFIFNESEFLVLAVFDGHGPRGHLVSLIVTCFVRKLFSQTASDWKILCNSLCSVDPPSVDVWMPLAESMLRRIFYDANTLLFRCSTSVIDLASSGCTATLCIHLKDACKLLTAHVGDSRAAVGICEPSISAAISKRKYTNGEDFSIKKPFDSEVSFRLISPQVLTEDHSPELPSEQARILKLNGSIANCGKRLLQTANCVYDPKAIEKIIQLREDESKAALGRRIDSKMKFHSPHIDNKINQLQAYNHTKDKVTHYSKRDALFSNLFESWGEKSFLTAEPATLDDALVRSSLLEPRRVLSHGTLAVSRALGDFLMIPSGCTHAPDVSILSVPVGSLLVLASDGVWQVLDDKEFLMAITPAIERSPCVFGPQDAANSVANAAWISWLQKSDLMRSQLQRCSSSTIISKNNMERQTNSVKPLAATRPQNSRAGAQNLAAPYVDDITVLVALLDGQDLPFSRHVNDMLNLHTLKSEQKGEICSNNVSENDAHRCVSSSKGTDSQAHTEKEVICKVANGQSRVEVSITDADHFSYVEHPSYDFNTQKSFWNSNQLSFDGNHKNIDLIHENQMQKQKPGCRLVPHPNPQFSMNDHSLNDTIGSLKDQLKNSNGNAIVNTNR